MHSKGTKPYIYMYPFSPNSLPSRLPHNTEQGSLCCTYSKSLFSSLWFVLCVNVSFCCKTKWISFFFIHCSIVGIQFCVTFCCTANQISYTCTHIHSFLGSSPIKVIIVTWWSVLNANLITYFNWAGLHFCLQQIFILLPCLND